VSLLYVLSLQCCDILAKDIAITPNCLHKSLPSSSREDLQPSARKNLQPPLLPRHSLKESMVQCKTYSKELRPLPGRRPWDVWDKRSLRKQRRENAAMRCSKDTGYSRGPKIFKELEKLKSRSHS